MNDIATGRILDLLEDIKQLALLQNAQLEAIIRILELHNNLSQEDIEELFTNSLIKEYRTNENV